MKLTKLESFRQQYKYVYNNSSYDVYKMRRDDRGLHPIDYSDVECEFAAKCIYDILPKEIYTILDVGSYRKFVLGLLSSYYVDVMDIRPLQGQYLENQTRIQLDAKNLNSENKYDVITCLSSIEHFGLGRYGDELDLKADEKAFNNFIKALTPGGTLIFTTTIKRGYPEICFNAHRIYNLDEIYKFCKPLDKKVEEWYYSRKLNRMCSSNEITDKPQTWDVYMGCWRKKE